MPTPLEVVWRNRLTTLIANLATGGLEHEEIANLARHIGADYAGRFLIELIQNANDQALLASMHDTTVVIVRTTDFVCVTNCGLPFDEKGVRMITSLGVSAKDAAITIGNKGVGFKAVFEVSGAPEIYSASTQASEAGFEAPGGERFRFHQDPLGQNGMRTRLEHIARGILAERPLDEREICRLCNPDPLAAIMEAIGRSAPFRYPIALDSDWLLGRLEALCLPEEARAAQTLVVLPLLRNSGGEVDTKVAKVVEKAFADLVECGGSLTLFLDGVARIIVDDRVLGLRRVLCRGPVMASRNLSRGSECIEITTEHRVKRGGEEFEQNIERWLLVRRTIGKFRPGYEDDGQRESLALNAAAQKLPNKNWGDVKTATVTIAVPIPKVIDGKLGREGMLCIGLPTTMHTGTPLWLDAHFHGNIPRTEVYWTQRYNEILLEEAVALAADLVDCLKTDPSLERRRLASLALEPASETPGAILRGRLHAPGALAAGPVILADDGESFVRAADLALPALEDQPQFTAIAATPEEARAHGFLLPDAILLAKARDVLERLPGYSPPPLRADGRFLTGIAGAPSLIERAADEHRSDGPAFWDPFLRWLVTRYGVAPLAEQRVLPVGRVDLAPPAQRIFYRPWVPVPGPTSSSTSDEEVARGDEGEDEEEDLGVLPDEIQNALSFLDEDAVPMRELGRKKRSALGLFLAPTSGPALVRAPRRGQLINEVVIPRLQEIGRRNDGDLDRLAVAILAQALDWISRMKPGSSEHEQVKRGELLVPAIGPPESARGLVWAIPGNLYFGHGWLEGAREALLDRVHRDAPGTALVSWSTFTNMLRAGASDASSRGRWRQQLHALGIADRPRVHHWHRVTNAFYLSAGTFLPYPSCPAPVPGVDELWKSYLAHVARSIHTNYVYGDYYLDDVYWIDGLEDPEARTAVFELMLAIPEQYETRAHSVVIRKSLKEKFVVPSFWIWALLTQRWSIVPTSDGPASPDRAWLLDADQRRDLARFRLLSSVPARFDPGRRLLINIGVCTLADAPAARLIEALHDLAARLPLEGHDERSARSLVADLYGRLTAFDDEGDAEQLRRLRQRPIPVIRDNSLIAVNPQLVKLYVDDDPVRRAFFGDPALLHFVPLRNDTPEVRLALVLARALGKERVVLTSRTEIETGFVATRVTEAPALLLDFLENHFPGITVDLGLLIAYGGRVRQDPTKIDFQREWEQLKRTRLRRGSFRPDFPRRAFFEARQERGPELLVDEILNPREVLEESWCIIGIAHRDVWAMYARDAGGTSDRLQRFFAERRMGDAERHEIESLLGQGMRPHLQAWMPFFFALWRRLRPYAPIETFHSEWEQYSDRASTLATWLEQPALETALPPLRGAHRDAAIERLVAVVSLDWRDWRAALAELGLAWRFEKVELEYKTLRRQLWAALTASAARLATIDLDQAAEYLGKLEVAEPVVHLLDHPTDAGTLVQALAATVKQAIEAGNFSPTHGRLVDRLDRILKQDRPLDDAFTELSKREIGEFSNFGAGERRERAAEVGKNYLDLIAGVGAELGEAEAVAKIAQDERLYRLREGYFASRYSFLPELSARLARGAPLTFQRLSSANVFDTAQSRAELQRICPAMAAGKATPPMAPPRRLFGVTLAPEKILDDLKNGVGGLIGAMLRKAAGDAKSIDLNALRAQTRPDAPVPPTRKLREGKRRGRSPRVPNEQERQLLGLLGEVFVYELFSQIIPGFDYAAWVSENAVRYGVTESGDDDLGADFHFFDQDGVLSGIPNTDCFVEVKSTSGEGGGPFSITFNEWLRAEDCHDQKGKAYLVVRVANVAASDSVPRVFDILQDPVKLEKEGKLQLADQDLWAYVAAPPA